jgi:5-(carboxyamino)imidazole ribonucleotide synthase
MAVKKSKQPVKKIGILGGGQLGRMSALAAARLGIECIIYTDEPNAPASMVVQQTIIADYNDKKALKKFAGLCDVVTYEFENIPLTTIEYLQSLKKLVRPDDILLTIAQHRVHEKAYLNDIGIPTAKWAMAISASDVARTLDDWKVNSCILKTCRFGYDGKGQAKIKDKREIKKAWAQLKSDEIIIEEIIDFDYEISVIIARDIFGEIAIYDISKNEHKNHILSRSVIPSNIPAKVQQTAKRYIKKLAESIDLVGVMTLELFVTKTGKVLANEIAPRTHNSGHWTIDACAVSQFENHIRCVAGLPVGSAARHSAAVMINLIGDDVKTVPQYLAQKNACVHLYGKTEIRPARKMGHVTILK